MLTINEKEFLDIVIDIIVDSKTYLLIHDNNTLQEVIDYRKVFKTDIKKENILHQSNIGDYIRSKQISFKNLNLLSQTKLKTLKKLIETNIQFPDFSNNNSWDDILKFQYSFSTWGKENDLNYLYLLENNKKSISQNYFKNVVNFLLNNNETPSLVQFIKNHQNHLKPPIIEHIKRKCEDPILNDFLNNQKTLSKIFHIEKIQSSKITIDMPNFIAKYYLEESLDSQKYAKPINFFLKNYIKKDNTIKTSYSIIKIKQIIIVNETNANYDENKFLNYFEEFLNFYFKKQKSLYANETTKINKSSIFFKNHDAITKSIDSNNFFTYLELNENLKLKKDSKIINKI